MTSRLEQQPVSVQPAAVGSNRSRDTTSSSVAAASAAAGVSTIPFRQQSSSVASTTALTSKARSMQRIRNANEQVYLQRALNDDVRRLASGYGYRPLAPHNHRQIIVFFFLFSETLWEWITLWSLFVVFFILVLVFVLFKIFILYSVYSYTGLILSSNWDNCRLMCNKMSYRCADSKLITLDVNFPSFDLLFFNVSDV